MSLHLTTFFACLSFSLSIFGQHKLDLNGLEIQTSKKYLQIQDTVQQYIGLQQYDIFIIDSLSRDTICNYHFSFEFAKRTPRSYRKFMYRSLKKNLLFEGERYYCYSYTDSIIIYDKSFKYCWGFTEIRKENSLDFVMDLIRLVSSE